MKKIIRLTEGDLHKIVKNSVKRIMKEARNNRPLSDYANDITQQWRNSYRGDENREDLWDKYKDLDRMQRVHDLRNGEYQTAEYQGQEYTIDDPLPSDATIYIKYTGAPYAYNAYPNNGESLRDYIESRGESMEDITEWWME